MTDTSEHNIVQLHIDGKTIQTTDCRIVRSDFDVQEGDYVSLYDYGYLFPVVSTKNNIKRYRVLADIEGNNKVFIEIEKEDISYLIHFDTIDPGVYVNELDKTLLYIVNKDSIHSVGYEGNIEELQRYEVDKNLMTRLDKFYALRR